MAHDHNWGYWGHLADRYRNNGPRRILALDGGGIRGVLSLQILRELESQLRERYKRGTDFRLSDCFDYIGGTSTGAIIAAGLARGMSVDELLRFYLDFGREVFTPSSLVNKLWSLYDDGPLQRKLREVFGETTTLEPQHLRTLLLVVTRNATTDSAWPINSNPSAKYNEPSRPDCNLRIPLWRLVRASTAAPVFFRPEVLRWDPADPTKSFVFVDGGTTPYNNPAALMARMATEAAYRLGWAAGERNLLVVSVGAGLSPTLGPESDASPTWLGGAAYATLLSLMFQASVDQDVIARATGRCVHGDEIDREVKDLVPRMSDGSPAPLGSDLGRAFLYARYDAELTAARLARAGLDVDPRRVRSLDSVDSIDELIALGKDVAKQVRIDDFGRFVDPAQAPLWSAGGGEGRAP